MGKEKQVRKWGSLCVFIKDTQPWNFPQAARFDTSHESRPDIINLARQTLDSPLGWKGEEILAAAKSSCDHINIELGIVKSNSLWWNKAMEVSDTYPQTHTLSRLFSQAVTNRSASVRKKKRKKEKRRKKTYSSSAW